MSGHGAEGIHPQTAPYIIEKDIAAVFQCSAHIHRPGVAVLQAAGLVTAVIQVPAGTIDRVGGVKPGRKSGSSHGRFEGGPRCVQPLKNAVQQGRGFLCRQGGIITAVVVQIIARPVGGSQNPTGFYIHHNGCPVTGFPPATRCGSGLQVEDLVPQGGLQGALQVGVQGQHQGGTGGGGAFLYSGAHGTVQPGVDQQLAVLPPQQVIVSGFQSALADDAVHSQPFFLGGGPLLGGNGPGKTQGMGQQGTLRPGALPACSQADRAVLHQPGLVNDRHAFIVQRFRYQQFPRRNGRTKGGKLCFHILAAYDGLHRLYGLL